MPDLKFERFDKMRAKAQRLTAEVRGKLYVNAGRAGGRMIAAQARTNAERLDDPETARAISKNIAVRYRKRKSQQTGDVVVSVGVLYPRGRMPKGNLDDGKSTPHWHLLELGTERMPAQPFLRPAGMQAADAAFDAIARNLDNGLNREIKKL